jgi:transcriptional regulator with PAS, ATPase and Fis domain
LELAKKTSEKRVLVLAYEELGDLAAAEGNDHEAKGHYEEGLRHARSLGDDADVVYEVGWRLARVYLSQSRHDDAERLALEAMQHAEKSSDRRELGHALATMAMIRADQKHFAEARALVERAIDEFRAIRTPYELAQTNEIAAEVVRKDPAGSGAEILGHLFEARRLYGKLGAAKASDRVGKELERVEASLHPDAVEPETSEQRSAEDTLILADDSMRKLVQTAKRAAPLTEIVLIQGETGTGKELIARLIHESGPRAPRPFVALNCAAMPENLLESQLFGHRKGAFTGATESHEGLLPSAKSGTVLLDEIDKATVEFQAKFLRVLDERAVRPVGAVRTVPLKARIICSSNRDLKELAENRMFLPDLYFRIATITLQIRPLRERPEDVVALVEHFLRKCDGRFGPERYELSRDAEYALIAYDWPGNVRELRNVVERAAFFAHETGRIELDHLPLDMREGPEAGNPEATLPERIASFERRHIVAALRKAKGVKSEAARVLGVSRKGLGDRLRRLGIE